MNTSDFINNAEYLIRQCLNQTQIDPLIKAWLQDACLDLAKAREKDIQQEMTNYNSFDDWMNEIENYATRRERALEDTDVLLWAKTAWDIQQEKIEKYETILKHAMSEKSGVFFICGEAGEKDSMGLPERIMVCPTYGLDGFASYKKDRDYNAC
jgi:hypothetical protein